MPNKKSTGTTQSHKTPPGGGKADGKRTKTAAAGLRPSPRSGGPGKQSRPAKPRPYVLHDEAPIHGYDPWTIRVRDELDLLKPKPHHTLKAGLASVEVRPSDHSLWIVCHWTDGHVALRPAYTPSGGLKLASCEADGADACFEARTPIGPFKVRLRVLDPKLSLLRITTTFTPVKNLRFPYWPRDLYTIDAEGDPVATRGVIHAMQRDAAAGLIYLSIAEPAPATLLYVQHLTWANGYFQTTETEAKGVVGGEWPHLGYQPPASKEFAMTAGEEEEWSDIILRFCDATPETEGHRAQLFLESLAAVYRHLPPPDTLYRDWPKRAEETLKSLESPKCWVSQQGLDLLHPYVNAEHPESMTQAVLIPRLAWYANWSSQVIPLIEKLRRGLWHFYDETLQSVRRYLPAAAPDKDPDLIDSWYLYHVLIDLANLAGNGDEKAKEILAKSIGFGIKVARHYNYRWPVQLSLVTLEPHDLTPRTGLPGETDVPGLYAYLMLKARDVLGEEWYVEEARRALEGLRGLNFEIGYQFNNVAWSATACARMWKETGDSYYLGMCYCFLASFFHNTILWEPDYGLTRAYSLFMGVTCLHDGEYTAMFEEYEAYTAFHELLDLCGDEIDPSARLLVTEYCRFLLSRGWYYYPGELPEDVICDKPRNGEIDHSLAIPLEDLYPSRTKAGSVGQEIYGAGGSFEILIHAYRRVEGVPYLLFCEYPLRPMDGGSGKDFAFRVQGDEDMSCRLRIIPEGNGKRPPATLRRVRPKAEELKPVLTPEGHLEFQAKGGEEFTLSWDS